MVESKIKWFVSLFPLVIFIDLHMQNNTKVDISMKSFASIFQNKYLSKLATTGIDGSNVVVLEFGRDEDGNPREDFDGIVCFKNNRKIKIVQKIYLEWIDFAGRLRIGSLSQFLSQRLFALLFFGMDWRRSSIGKLAFNFETDHIDCILNPNLLYCIPIWGPK